MSDVTTSDTDSTTFPACFRNKFNGLYKTFNKGDLAFPINEWVRIHDGTCECEGKTADECQEPGDPG
jgi:hypothetical protein